MSEAPIHLPASVQELREVSSRVQDILRSSADNLVAIPKAERTLENTLLKLQEDQSQAAALQTLCTFPTMASTPSFSSPPLEEVVSMLN